MKRKLTVVIIGIIIMLMVAAGCSAPSMSQSTPTMVPEAAAADVAGGYNDGMETNADYKASMEEAGVAEGLGGLANAPLPQTDRKLVYTASLELNTKQFDKDYRAIKAALAKVNGYVENENTVSNTTDYGASRYSTLLLRVPVGQYNSFLDEVSGVGEVISKNISTEDLTSQYFDTDARIAILEERKARLMDHLRNATKTEDIIKLESELSDVLYELDQFQGNKRHMDNLVEYTQVRISLNEVIAAETITKTGDPLGARAANAYQISLTGVGNFLQNFAVGFAAAAPILMLVAIVLAGTFGIIKLVKVLRQKIKARQMQ